jgi:chromosome segregation ATPase
MEIKLSDERVASLENEVKHINNDISEIKSDVSDIRQINGNIEKSLARLTVIAEENQRALPMVESLNVKMAKLENAPKRLDALEKWRWLIAGGFSALAFYVSYADKIKHLFVG